MRKRIHDTSVTHSYYNQYTFAKINNFFSENDVVYIRFYATEGSAKPHFHIETENRSINIKILIEEPNYLDIPSVWLSSDQKVKLNAGLDYIWEEFGNRTTWERIKDMWNVDLSNNSEVSTDTRPDYRLLPNKE